jgi:hypothetical protein
VSLPGLSEFLLDASRVLLALAGLSFVIYAAALMLIITLPRHRR